MRILYKYMPFMKKFFYNDIPSETFLEYNKMRSIKNNVRFCYAPFVSMYLGMDGNITSCFNRSYSLGKFPEQRLEDVWFGERVRKMRELIDDHILPPGCYMCKYYLEEKNYRRIGAINYDRIPMHNNKYPLLMEFELDNTCNLCCSMCCFAYSSIIQKRKEISLPKNPYDHNFLKQLEQFIPHLKEAKFIGGEPFLINIYYEIWDMIIKKNPECLIYVQTNGTIRNKRIDNILERGNFQIGISVDSIKKELYESIRIGAKYEDTIENINYYSYYSKKRNRALSISFCPMRNNWSDLPDLIKYCQQQSAYLYINNVYYPKNMALWSLGQLELVKISRYLKKQKYGNYYGDNVCQNNIEVLESFIRQIDSWCKKKEKVEDSKLDNAVSIRENKSIILRKLKCHFKGFPEEYKKCVQRLDLAIEKTPLKERVSSGLNVYKEFPDESIILAINGYSDVLFEKYLEDLSY